MARKKELDKLSLDMIQCKKDGYGCHYGDWYAVQNRPVVIEKNDVIPEGWIPCKHCGKYFKPYGRQLYCEMGCQKAAQKIRDGDKYAEYNREKSRRYRERKKDGR